MTETLEIVFRRTWWRYAPGDGDWFTFLYHWFNILEGIAWFVFAALVFRRYRTHRNSPLELYYAIAFFVFGLTDIREAWAQTSWLIWLKLLILIALLVLRRTIMSRYYPNARVY